HAITVRIGEQQSVVVEIVRGELPGNSGPEAHPHDHRQESDDGQRRDPRDSPEEKLGTVEAHGSGFERKHFIGCSHYPQSAYPSRRKAELSIVLASRRTPHRV